MKYTFIGKLERVLIFTVLTLMIGVIFVNTYTIRNNQHRLASLENGQLYNLQQWVDQTGEITIYMEPNEAASSLDIYLNGEFYRALDGNGPLEITVGEHDVIQAKGNGSIEGIKLYIKGSDNLNKAYFEEQQYINGKLKTIALIRIQ